MRIFFSRNTFDVAGGGGGPLVLVLVCWLSFREEGWLKWAKRGSSQ
jgi:hypothetical protein